MSPRSWQERAQDILDAIVEIRAFVGDMDVAALAIDAKTLKAIQLNFIVIGEAANHIPDDVQTRHPQVPWHLVRGMRNRLVHAYFNVDPKIVWDTIHYHLNPLADALKQALEHSDPEATN